MIQSEHVRNQAGWVIAPLRGKKKVSMLRIYTHITRSTLSERDWSSGEVGKFESTMSDTVIKRVQPLCQSVGVCPDRTPNVLCHLQKYLFIYDEHLLAAALFAR